MATQNNAQIREFLTDFGLTEREINIYLTLLKTGPNTIMNLARETGIKRSTTHNNVEELIKKGLVSQTNYGERRMVIAEDPEKLKFLMEQKKFNVKRMEESLPDVIKEIQGIAPLGSDKDRVSVKYYEGKEGASIIYKEAFSSKELRSYVNLSAISQVFPENAQLFIDYQQKNKNLKVWEILDESETSKKRATIFAQDPNFKYKTSHKAMNLSAIDVLLYDNTVALINFKESIIATKIYNKDYYENSKALFNFIWDMLS